MSDPTSKSLISCPSEVRDLVEKFHEHVDAYKSGRYNETQVRREFVDPLFEALGWDITNKAGLAEAYKDVIHEDAVKIGGATKARIIHFAWAEIVFKQLYYPSWFE